MLSKKCQKYMSRYNEENYAPKTRKLEKSDLVKYKNRDSARETPEASSGNCIKCCKEEKEINIPTQDYDETVREENLDKSYQEGRQRISCPDKGRCEVEETDSKIQTREEKMKEKVTAKEKKHEAKETKAYEKKEDKREAKKESKGKKK